MSDQTTAAIKGTLTTIKGAVCQLLDDDAGTTARILAEFPHSKVFMNGVEHGARTAFLAVIALIDGVLADV